MSSENIHINRQNYEEYFLLYVDNELSATGRSVVEAFAATHLDLQEELDLLLQTTVLQTTPAVLQDKSFLMADSMKLNAVDDTLLLYIDDELTGDQKKKVEEMLKSKPEYKLQYNLLLNTKLSKEEITYPYKKELYRHTERKISYNWMRVAAAIIVIAALGLLFLVRDNGNIDQPVVASGTPVKTVNPAPQPSNDQVASTTKNAGTIPESKQQDNKDLRKEKAIQNSPVQQAPELVAENSQTVQDIQNNTGVITPVDATPVKPVEVIASAGNDLGNVNNTTVTETNTTSYNTIDAAITTPQDYAVADNQRSGSVKGLLRKATRFIEKRTGLNPVNDDDELLIGALAIKLK
jgi:hypothetical protein